MYKLIFPETYEKRERKFLKKHPELVERYKNILKLLEFDPGHPSLSLHKLKGKFAGKYAIYITRSYRIILTFAVTERGIILLDIGTHDEVYRK